MVHFFRQTNECDYIQNITQHPMTPRLIKMQVVKRRDYNMRYMPCEWCGHMVSDPTTNLLVVLKGNEFLKLKGFLKHDHFVCKLA